MAQRDRNTARPARSHRSDLSYVTRDVPIRGEFASTPIDADDDQEDDEESDADPSTASETTDGGKLRTRPSSGPPTSRVNRSSGKAL